MAHLIFVSFQSFLLGVVNSTNESNLQQDSLVVHTHTFQIISHHQRQLNIHGRNCVRAFLDLHAHARRRGVFVFGNDLVIVKQKKCIFLF